MNFIKNRYLYWEQANEKEFYKAITLFKEAILKIFQFSKITAFAGIYIAQKAIEFSFEIIALFFVEPKLYLNDENEAERKEIETQKNNWRVL